MQPDLKAPLRGAAARSTPRLFQAARWLTSAHAQTILPALLRRPPRHPMRRERLELPDGDFLDLDVLEPDGAPRGFALVVHGLEGSSRSGYVRGTVHAAHRRGLVAVALNHRGCSGAPNRLARSYHAADTGDLRYAIDWIGARWPELRGGVIGFSLGANQTLKLMGEAGHDLPDHLAAAVAVSPPFDTGAAADHLDGPRCRLYRYLFLRSLVQKALAKARRFPDRLSPAAVLRAATSLRAYDDAVTAPLHGFASAADYYARGSCGRYLEGVRRPTLVLTARDDPIVPGASIPPDAAMRSPALTLAVTEQGGHCGFVAAGGSPLRPRFWAEQQAVLWLTRRLAGR